MRGLRCFYSNYKNAKKKIFSKVFYICLINVCFSHSFVDISKVKGFKDCKDSLLYCKVEEEVSHGQYLCALKLYSVELLSHRWSLPLSFIPPKSSFSLTALGFLHASQLKRVSQRLVFIFHNLLPPWEFPRVPAPGG